MTAPARHTHEPLQQRLASWVIPIIVAAWAIVLLSGYLAGSFGG
jgi:hypothetical protein